MKIRRPSSKSSHLIYNSDSWAKFTKPIFLISSFIHLKLLVIIISICLGFSSFLICRHWACQSDLFEVSQVQIKGCNRLTEEEILKISNVTAQDNLLSLDLKSIAMSIQSHPLVLTAEVKRKLPDHLMITIKEREPVAILNSDKMYLVDQHAKIIDKMLTDEHFSLPVIKGVDPKSIIHNQLTDSQNHKLQKAMELISLASKGTRILGINNIKQINVTESDNLILYINDSDIPLYFDIENLSSQFNNAEKVLYQLYQSGMYKKIAKIELDYGPGKVLASLKH
jgi:cell division protein FtsQ